MIKNIVGNIQLKEFTAAHAAFFEKERSKSVAGATVNRGLAVLSHMFTFALKTKGIIQTHPMARYGRIPEDEKALRVMTLEEERRLVETVREKDHLIGCYIGLLGETALRMTEGLLVKWRFVNFSERSLTVEASKNYKTRHVPLSDYALELLRSLPRVLGCDYAFASTQTKDRRRDPRGPFYAGRKLLDMEWVGFHDFRHFRASQWVMRGIDLRTVREVKRRRSGEIGIRSRLKICG